MRYFHVDAFTDRPFRGNPAGVVPLEAWPDDAALLAMAGEHKHAETAFVKLLPDGSEADAHLRWFTPAMEVELCGHATLATAHTLRHHLGWTRDRIVFDSLSGLLPVGFFDGRIVLDFPARSPEAIADTVPYQRALGCSVDEVHAASTHLLCVVNDAATVRSLSPDMEALRGFEQYGIIVTAPGDEGYDVVSRFFAPRAGVPEDPVTGSAHCSIAPYWCGRLKTSELECYQASPRGGALRCTMDGDRVHIAGRAVTYLEGTILAPT